MSADLKVDFIQRLDKLRASRYPSKRKIEERKKLKKEKVSRERVL